MIIDKGKGVITIKTDGFISCLIIKEPQVVDWHASGGSIERYYACLPYQEESRKIVSGITNLVQEIDSIEQFIDSGFPDLLSNGEYDFYLRESGENFTHIFNTSLWNTNSFVKDFGDYFRSGGFEDTEKITRMYYPYKDGILTYTQPVEYLNEERVKYYESIIQHGGRPKAIVLRNKFTYDPNVYGDWPTTYSANYVLDGHHKLMAYLKLGVSPGLIQIDALRPYDLKNFDYDVVPLVEDKMHSCQLSHIISCGFRVDFSKEKLYESFIDKHLEESDVFDSYLLRNMENAMRSDYIYTDKAWTSERIRKLMNRVKTSENKLYLWYYKPGIGNISMRVKTWEEMCSAAEVTL